MSVKPVKINLSVVLLPAIILMMSACTKSYIRMPDEGVVIKDSTLTIDSVHFSADIKPIFSANCTSCHFAGGDNPDLESENVYSNLITGNYINISDPENSDLFIKGDGTPGHADSYLTSYEHAKIITWIQQGALDN